MAKYIKMGQRDFAKLVGYNRTTMYRHDLYNDRLSETEVEDIRQKVVEYVRNEIERYGILVERI